MRPLSSERKQCQEFQAETALWMVPLQGNREGHGILGELRVGLLLYPMYQGGYPLWWQAVGFWSAGSRLRTWHNSGLTLPMRRKTFLIKSAPSFKNSSRFWVKFLGLALRKKHVLKTILSIWGTLSGQKEAWSRITQRICLKGVFLRVGLYVKEAEQVGTLKTGSDTMR